MTLLTSTIAVVLATIFYGLAALHVIWIIGPGPGRSVIPTQDGKPVLNPGPLTTAAVAALLTVAGTLCLWRAEILPWTSPAIARWALWGVVAVFTARAIGDFNYVGFFKRTRDSKFARYDTIAYSPLCAVIATLASLLNVLASGRP